MKTVRAGLSVTVLAVLVVASGCRRHKEAPAEAERRPSSTSAGGAGAASTVTGPARSSSSVGPSDTCISCRDANCGAERLACEGEPACAKNLGCRDECKGDKACMNRCVQRSTKFAALGKCLLSRCRKECVSP
jgi:hypothetical protein